MTRRDDKGVRSCAALLRTTALFVLLSIGATASATPYIPADDSVVLERVPARSALERLAPLRAAVSANPTDLPATLSLARGYIDIGRSNSDPRFVAYAESVLAPWLARPTPEEPVLVLQATALQYLHQFDASLALLDRALVLRPLDGQAWLTRASLLELRGSYADARRACARLARAADELIALTCLCSVDSRSGKLAASYQSLMSLAGVGGPLPSAVQTWTQSVLAEMAERLGDDRTAEANLVAALRVEPDDPYVKASYADLLLRLNRPLEVTALLRGGEAQDPLLLRLAIAGARAASPEATRWASMYEERILAAERDRDFSHQREQAMFLLDVRGDARGALAAAASNWNVQREPADIRIYLRAAERSASSTDRAAIVSWLAATHYEDRTLPAIATPVAARQP